MALDTQAVLKLGKLSRIALSDAEAAQISSELSAVLEWIEQLQEVDVTAVAPMTSALDQQPTMREDLVNDGHDPARVLCNAPAEIKGYFSVPKVIE